jgi:hypothetical protein
MDGDFMGERSTHDQPVLIWSEAVQARAHYKRPECRRAVLPLAVPRRVCFSA